jgi:hypothetical protein
MRQIIYSLAITGFLIFGLCGFSYSQKLSSRDIDKIKNEISLIFDKSIKAGEQLDVKGISENVNDSLQTGFIDNGFYFNSFEELMVRFKSGIRGLEYQKMNIDTKKITVLSENSVLLTAHGNFSAKVVDGRMLTGRFAWTFVYANINGKWKVIHSHMSNPNS